MKEQVTQKSILDWLAWHKIFAFKISSTGIYIKKTDKYIPASTKGLPDIMAIKDGKAYGLEVKAKYGKLSEFQEEIKNKFHKAGAVYCVVRSIEDVERLFD